MIHYYCGWGKGKTTALLGAGMRAYGAGLGVLLVQFLKDHHSSELSVLPYEVYEAPDKLSFNPGKEYEEWVNGAVEYIKKSDADLILLDEFADIVGSFISADEAAQLIDALGDKEIIITGHKQVPKLLNKADYITNMEKIKHPYDIGTKARKGIEY